ncbi:MAG: hypothetical protein Q4D33_14050 [Prevotellaceae bacterium]|nr:hypothetical protein [Prevotellaceae bacterium]
MKRELFSVALALLMSFGAMAKDYHVAKTGSDQNDGSAEAPLSIDKDLLGNPRSASAPKVGPFENLKVGENTIMVWKFKK